jgi:hypothetical protein
VGPDPAERGPRRHLEPDPGGQQPPRAARAVEGRARPRGRRRAGHGPRGPAARGGAGIAGHARHLPGGVVAHRAGRVADRRPLPGAAAWGGYPGGLPVTKGAPLFPRLSVTPA